jgi:hypothetical protein
VWQHLTPLEFIALVAFAVWWLVPTWLLKLIAVADAFRRFRARWPRGHVDAGDRVSDPDRGPI